MKGSPGVFPLEGVVQHYSWGGFDFLPSLLGLTKGNSQEQTDNPQPFAEYWLGAHPNHPARVANGKPLTELLQHAPQLLGTRVSGQFTSLPYLLKILDVRQMLSIQVHPSIAGAEAGFEAEEKRGVSIKAPDRNYKDRNHKPELMVALSDFWLLHGFKSPEAIRALLSSIPEFSFLLPDLENGLKPLYERVMRLPQAEVNERLKPLAERIEPLYREGKLEKSSEDFWAARALATFCRKGQIDRGLFSIYLFNLVHLKKNEGIFQPEGMPHAYLEGQNVEVMANSDNVLRAGLTDKHIDVEELLKHVNFITTVPRVLQADEAGRYPSPAREFALYRYALKKGEERMVRTQTAEIFLVLEGSVRLIQETEWQELKKGKAALAGAGLDLPIMATADASLFRVTVPG